MKTHIEIFLFSRQYYKIDNIYFNINSYKKCAFIYVFRAFLSKDYVANSVKYMYVVYGLKKYILKMKKVNLYKIDIIIDIIIYIKYGCVYSK